MNTQRIEISYKTIIFTVLFLISLTLLWQIRSLLVLIYICFILMQALNPTVTKLEKYKIPRPVSILILYLLILSGLSFAVASIVPILIEQTSSLIQTVPAWLQSTTFFGASAIDLSSQFRILESLPANIARMTLSLFSNIFSGFVIFVITFYLLIERKNLDKYSFELFGQNGKKRVVTVFEVLESTLGKWVNAQLLLMVIVGLLSYLGYVILGLNFAVPLAILAGLLEIVPNIGPTVTAIISGLVGLTISPLTGLLAVGWGILIQQLENNIIVPKVMSERVDVNPLITIILIAAGAKIGGVMGAILAIPLYLTIRAIFVVLYQSQKRPS